MISIPFRYFTADIMQSDIQRWRDTATYDISEKTYIYNIIDSTYSIIIFLKKLHKNKRSGFYSEF